MYKVSLQKFLSLFLTAFFFLSPSCNSEGQKEVVKIEEDQLPTKRALRSTYRDKRSLTFVYPADPQYEDFYQARIEALKNNERFGLRIKSSKITEVTKANLENEIVFIVGDIRKDPLLMKLMGSLPIKIKEQSFVFDEKEYVEKDMIFKLIPYPNPYNQQLPIYLLTGNDDQAIKDFLAQNYPVDLSRFFWSSWGYEVRQKGVKKVAGDFNESTWALDKQIHFDFTERNDTILQTTHFQFIAHNSPLNKKQIESIAEKCEATYSIIEDFIGKPIKLPKIEYHFYPSVENKGLRQSSMQEASANFEKNSIAVVMNDNFHGSVLHPENKLVFRKALGKPNLIALEEGLTNYFTDTWQKKGYDFWTQKLFHSDNLPPLKELLDNDFYQNESYLVMGAMAGSFANFLIEKFGKNTFIKNYANWEKEDLLVLENDWLKYLESRTVSTPSANSSEKGIKELPYLKGFNFAHEGYRVYNGYGSQLAKQSLLRLNEIGSNAIAIVPYSFMRNPQRPDHIPILQSAGGENDQAVLFSHFEAKKMGIQTMLKPQIWLSGSWPGDIKMKNEKDWATFFDHYYRWVRHYALLAEINNLDSYCIGVEFAKATLAKEQEWRNIIRKIKGIYSGPLTYAANWGDEFENLKFWDELDFIGLNCYYPLSKENTPSKRTLTKSFEKVMDKIEKVHKQYNKQIVFTEIGFRSVDGTWKNPHAEADGRAFNEEAQELCYDIVLKGIENKKWCNGIIWWKWPSYMTYRGAQNTGFTPNAKQTENVIEKYFKTKN